MKVREFFSEPERWCRNYSGRTYEGKKCINSGVDPQFYEEVWRPRGVLPPEEAYSLSLLEAICRFYRNRNVRHSFDLKFQALLDKVVAALPKDLVKKCNPLEGKEYPIAVWERARSRTFEEVKDLVDQLDI